MRDMGDEINEFQDGFHRSDLDIIGSMSLNETEGAKTGKDDIWMMK